MARRRPRWRTSGRRRSLLGWLIGTVWRLALFLLLLPVPVALYVRVATPPTTAFMATRAVQRWTAGERPAWPAHAIVADSLLPVVLGRAVTASEDDRFYLHDGFDFDAIEAAIDERSRGGRLRGASTITQQLAKNLLLWEGRSWVRKGYEAWITIWLELLVSKERLLATYLNVVEWGDGIFGAEAAAQHWFGHSAATLTADEAARLAVVLPAPRRWAPTGPVADRRAPSVRARMQTPAPRRPTAEAGA